MGAMGSDVAVEAADVALMTDDVSRVPYLKWLSRTAVRTIRTPSPCPCASISSPSPCPSWGS